MKHRPILFLVALLALAPGLAGCGRDTHPAAPAAGGPGASAEAERAEVMGALADSPEALDEGEYDHAESWSAAGAAGGATLDAAIHPLRWWRVIRERDRSFEFAFADTDSVGRPTRAVVTVHTRMRGAFHVLAGTPGDSLPPRDSLDHIRKPLADHAVRRILLRRVPAPGDARARWRVVAVSGVEVTARDAQTEILSLRIQTAARDTTIENPLAFALLRRIVRVEPGEVVTLTATTRAADDVVVLLHRGARFRFENNGDGTHTGRWRAPDHRGLRHVGVNALARTTLFDDEAPYDSQAWILPYAVAGELDVDHLPRR